MPLPLLALAGLGQAGIGLGKLAFGAIQRNQSRRDLERLNSERPNIGVPLAIRERAAEPVAEELMQAQADESRRRTSQGIGALSKAGARGIVGGLPSLVASEQQNERARMANYNQERIRALGDLGRAEERVQDINMQNWNNEVAGARAEMGAGQQNIFGGVSDIGIGALGAVGGFNQSSLPPLSERSQYLQSQGIGGNMNMSTENPSLPPLQGYNMGSSEQASPEVLSALQSLIYGSPQGISQDIYGRNQLPRKF